MAGERKKARARYEVTGPGQLKGFPWGKLSAKQTDEGSLSFLQSLSRIVPFPSSVSAFAAATFPQGKAKFAKAGG